MREVMSNPLGGFYAAHGGSSIGRRGHFITSPEISVLFAEVCLHLALLALLNH